MRHIINVDPYDYEWSEDIRDRTKLLTREEWKRIEGSVNYSCAFGRSEVDLCEDWFRDNPDRIARILGFESWGDFRNYKNYPCNFPESNYN